MAKIQGYVYAFFQADRDPTSAGKWHAGVTYDYEGPDPELLSIKSNGKDVYAVYYHTQGGGIPYKLYEVDDDQDRRKIPIPVAVRDRVRDPWMIPSPSYQTAQVGASMFASSYAQSLSKGIVSAGMVGIGAYMAIATINSMQVTP